MAYNKDYGGTRQRKTKRRSHHKGLPDGERSFRCLDCDKLNYFEHRQVQRVAALRCKACQGPVEETAVSKEREELRSDRVLNREVPRCRACGNCVERLGIQGHLKENPECAVYYEHRPKFILEEAQREVLTLAPKDEQLTCPYCPMVLPSAAAVSVHIFERHRDIWAKLKRRKRKPAKPEVVQECGTRRPAKPEVVQQRKTPSTGHPYVRQFKDSVYFVGVRDIEECPYWENIREVFDYFDVRFYEIGQPKFVKSVKKVVGPEPNTVVEFIQLCELSARACHKDSLTAAKIVAAYSGVGDLPDNLTSTFKSLLHDWS